MRTIIAGSRGITDIDTVNAAVDISSFEITTVISGTARGVDKLGEQWAAEHNIPVERYPANWKPDGRLDKRAGYRRNELMATKASALVAVWDGVSKGTKHMIDIATKAGLKVFVYNTKDIDVWNELTKMLASKQEPLGVDFEKVLNDNKWDLYEE